MFWPMVGSQLPDDLNMFSKEGRAKRKIAISPSVSAGLTFPIRAGNSSDWTLIRSHDAPKM